MIIIFKNSYISSSSYSMPRPNFTRVSTIYHNRIMCLSRTFIKTIFINFISRSTSIHNYRTTIYVQFKIKSISMCMPWLIIWSHLSSIHYHFKF